MLLSSCLESFGLSRVGILLQQRSSRVIGYLQDLWIQQGGLGSTLEELPADRTPVLSTRWSEHEFCTRPVFLFERTSRQSQ